MSYTPELIGASDAKGRNITPRITYTCDRDFNTHTPGVYKFTYSVTDFNDNTLTANRTVVVNDEINTYAVGNKYILKASDFIESITLRSLANKENLKDEIIKAANIKIYDINTLSEVHDNSLINIDSYRDNDQYLMKFTILNNLKKTKKAFTTRKSFYYHFLSYFNSAEEEEEEENILLTPEASRLVIVTVEKENYCASLDEIISEHNKKNKGINAEITFENKPHCCKKDGIKFAALDQPYSYLKSARPSNPFNPLASISAIDIDTGKSF